MDQALHRIGKFHIQSPAGDTGDHTLVFLSDVLLHIFYLLQLIRLPLCLIGTALHLGIMLSHLRKNIPVVLHSLCLQASPQLLLDNAVNLQIRISADRRSKMTVILTCQSEMSGAFRAVFRLLHAPQGEGGNHAFFGFSLHLAQGHLKNFRPHLALNLENGPKLGHDL